MLAVKKSNTRGFADHGWLKSHHSFSFADYYDPANMNFGALRAINEDWIAGGGGFPTHGHRDMEIITYVTEGALAHRDSAGNASVIRPGEVQRMSAGKGVAHSEFNGTDAPVKLLQIWIVPDKMGVDFSYDQKSFDAQLRQKDLVLAVSRDGREGSISIHQDADLHVSRLRAEKELTFLARPERKLWLQVVKGTIEANGLRASAGDAVAGSGETQLKVSAREDSEFLLFDLA